MNQSTENVMLLTAFVLDVLREVENLESSTDTTPLKKMTDNYDLSNPYEMIPMQLYNDMCAWVEQQLGEEAIIKVGFAIGETVYPSLIDNGIIQEENEPLDIMEGLIIAASSMVQDPEERGWEIIKDTNESLHLRRTQTFNGKLQFGLLKGLIQKSNAKEVNVSYLKQISQGDEFDEYLVTWENE